MSIVKSITTSARPIALRGGRMRKRGGQVVSFAPHFADLLSGASRVALGGVLILSGMAALSPTSAAAATCAGTTQILCSGGADADGTDAPITLSIDQSGTTIVTEAGFGIDSSETAGTAAITLAASDDADITFTDANASAITGAAGGIASSNAGAGNSSITTNGTITAVTGNAINAATTGAGNLTVSATGSLSGAIGINAVGEGSGSVTVTNSANILNASNRAIRAVQNNNGNLTVTNSGTLTSTGAFGISTFATGTGDLSLTNTGNVTGALALHAQQDGVGALTVSNNATLTGNTGINAAHGGTGDLSISTGAASVITGSPAAGNGINAVHNGDGDIAITTAAGGTITGAAIGINASSSADGAVSITNGANITSSDRSIRGWHVGTGTLDISNSGVLTSTGTFGLSAYADGGSTISVTNSGTVNGATAIHAQNNGDGALVITNSGTANAATSLDVSTLPTGDAASAAADIDELLNAIAVNAIHNGDAAITITNNDNIVSSAAITGALSVENNDGNDNRVTLSALAIGINAEHSGAADIVITNTADIQVTSNIDASVTFVGADPTDNDFRLDSTALAIFALHEGSGDITITNSGDITATALANYEGTNIYSLDAAGIAASHNGTGDVNITNDGDINSTDTGIYALHGNDGNISITNNATIEVEYQDGIRAVHGTYNYRGDSTGDISITNAGTILSEDDGIVSDHYGNGDIIITNDDTITADDDGMAVYHGGTGTITITNAGTIAAEDDDGIDISHQGTGDIFITNSGSITADDEGIELDNDGNGNGNVILINSGSITAGADGLDLEMDGNGTISITNSGSIVGDLDAIEIDHYGSGDININISASGSASGYYSAINASVNDGNLTITNSGTLTNTGYGSAGIAIYAGPTALDSTGTVSITNDGTMTGSIVTETIFSEYDYDLQQGIYTPASLTDTVTNNGTWNTADGTSIFGAGVDSVTNNGTINAANASFTGLENFANNGTLSLANNQAGDTLTTDGAMQLNEDGNLVLDISGNDVDQIAADGAVIIDGSTLTINQVGPRALAGRYTLLTADSVTGEFGDNNVPDTAFLDLELDYSDTTKVDLTIEQVATFTDVAQTPNQISTATALEDLDSGNDLIDELLYLPDAAAANAAFDQLSGEAHASLRSSLADDSRLPRNAVLNRLQNREGSAIWGELFYGAGNLDQAKNRNTGGAKRDAWGAILGADANVAENVTVGFAASLINHENDQQSRGSKVESETVNLLAYLGAESGKARFKLGAGYAWGDINSSRSVSFGRFNDRLTANYDASLFQAFAELGYRLPLGGGYVEPMANVIYIDTTTDGFTEKGGLAALTVEKRSETTTLSTLGARFSTAQSGIFSISGMAGWQHGFGKLTPTSVMTLGDSDSFIIAGAPQSRNAAVAQIEAKFDVGETTSISLGYDGVLGNVSHDHAAKVSVRLKF